MRTFITYTSLGSLETEKILKVIKDKGVTDQIASKEGIFISACRKGHLQVVLHLLPYVKSEDRLSVLNSQPSSNEPQLPPIVSKLVQDYLRKEKQASKVALETGKISDKNGQMDITVRPATSADYTFYLKIYEDLEIDHPPADEAMWNKRDMPGVTIITQGTEPVGYIWTQKYGEVYYLAYLIIVKEHRRKGIGTKALRLVKNQAKQLGYAKWGLDCDVLHQIPYKMYIKAGLSKEGELHHLKAPYTNPSMKRKTNLSTLVVYDQDRWSVLEKKYGMWKGRIDLFFSTECCRSC